MATENFTNPKTGEKVRVKMTQICFRHKGLIVENDDTEKYCTAAALVGTCEFIDIGVFLEDGQEL